MKLRTLLSLGLLLLCAACSRPAPPADSLSIAQQWSPRSLNPALENGTSSTEWSMLVFSYLVKFDDSGTLIPDLATEVPTTKNGGISADGKTIVYHIRKGVRFADGTPLTAADCAWSIEAINNPRNLVQSRFAYDDVARAEARDPATLVLHLKRPFPPVIVVVGAPQGFPILPKHVLAKDPDFNHAPFNRAPFGSGPYKVERWLPGDRVELTANPYYWRGAPGVAALTVRFVSNPQTAMNMLRTHEVQGYFDEQDYANYPLLKQIPGYRVTSTQQNAVGALIFNTTDAITGDARVRRALAEAVDISSAIRKVYRGALQTHDAGAGLFLWAFDPKAYPDVPYDPAAARQLLSDAGWQPGADGVRRKNGKPLDVLLILQAATPGDASLANLIVQYERAVGARVTLKEFNITQFVAPANENGPVYGGKFQMALYSFENGDDPDTTDQFACANVPPGGYNKSRFCDAKADALLARGLSTYDRNERKVIYSQLERELFERMPIALLYRRAQVNTFPDRLEGQTTSLSGAFWNVAAWRWCAPKIWPALGTPSAQTALRGPVLVLQGGGSDIDAQFRRMHDLLSPAASKPALNVVVLTAHTDDNDYTPYIKPLGPFASVQTIGIPACVTPEQLDALVPIVDKADAVFFGGGDQANYVWWKGSKFAAALQRLWARNGAVGGTSAGLAVQGQYVYDSVAADRLHENDPDYAVTTANAVRDPFEPEISFTTGFLSWPPLRNVITDTHFARRDRFGRTVAFLARLERENHLPTGTITALAVDERSSLVVNRDGIGTLLKHDGPGYQSKGAYLVRLVSVKRLERGKPLLATVTVLHVAKPGTAINLLAKDGDGVRYEVTVDGSKANPYSRNPYR